MAARLLGATLGVAVPMVLARALTPDDFGTYKLAWLLALNAQHVLPLGVTMSLYYFVPREPERRGAWLGQALAFTTLAGALAAVLLLAAEPLLLPRLGGPSLARALPWIAALAALLLAGSSLDVGLNSLGKVRAGAVVRVATDLGRGLAMIAGALWTRSVLGVLAGAAVATAARAVVGVVLLGREAPLSASAPALRRQLAYALPFGAAALLFVPQQSFHQWAVAAEVTPALFAIYAVGCFQLPIVDILYTPVSEVLQLGIAEEERRGRTGGGLALFREAVARLAFVFVPVMGFIVAAAPALVELLFTDRYLAAVPILRVSVLSVALAALPLDGVFRARAARGFMLATSAAKLALTVPAVLAGLAAWGMTGAIAGYVASEAAVRAVQLARASRLLGGGVADALPWRALARFALGTAAAMPLAWLAAARVPAGPLLRVAAAGAAFAAVHLAVLAACGGLRAEWAALARLLPGRRGPAGLAQGARAGL
jgi:O-antigen/teichoic acid export membrane protein